MTINARYEIGELDQRIELQEPSYVDDGQGGQVKTFVVRHTVWAHVRALSGRERSHSELLQSEGGYMVVIRNSYSFDESWRVRWINGSRLMNIRFIPDSGNRKMYQPIECERGVAT